MNPIGPGTQPGTQVDSETLFSLSLYSPGGGITSITPEEKRRRRLAELVGKLKSNKLTDKHEILGWGGLKWGCRIERVREYLDVIEMAGLIKIGGDVITWIGPE